MQDKLDLGLVLSATKYAANVPEKSPFVMD